MVNRRNKYRSGIEEEQIKAASHNTSEEIALLARSIQSLENEVSHLRDDLDEIRAKGGDPFLGPDWPSEASGDQKQIATALRKLQEKRRKRYEDAGKRRNSLRGGK